MTTKAIYHIGVEKPITPAEPLPPLPDIPRGSLVIVEGRAPIWRYGMALHLLHGSPAGAVAFYDLPVGALWRRAPAPHFTEGFVKAYANLAKGDVKCRFPMQS